MNLDLSGSKTRENLMRAFAGESMARNRYYFAGQVAKKQNMYFIQQIFDFTAHQETQHAKIFYNFLKGENGQSIEITAGYPVGNYDNLSALLRDAQKHEYEEFNEIYPEFAHIARSEGFIPIANAFEQIAKIEQTHGNRFSTFAELIDQMILFKATANTTWMCLNCGHIHTGMEAPEICEVCHHSQGYFVPEKYYKFVVEEYIRP